MIQQPVYSSENPAGAAVFHELAQTSPLPPGRLPAGPERRIGDGLRKLYPVGLQYVAQNLCYSSGMG